jgi:hypothetical protein
MILAREMRRQRQAVEDNAIETEVAPRQRPRTPLISGGGIRRRGDNGVSPRPRGASTLLLDRLRRHAPRPAALEWQDAQLPLLGRLWANFWLPTVLLAGCLVAMVYLLQTSGVATAGYDIQSLQMQRDDWQLRNEQLQFELSKRRSLTWIEAEATGRLGMVRPQPTALVYLRDGVRVTAATATPAATPTPQARR